MTNSPGHWTDAVVTNRTEMLPLPTDVQPQFQRLDNIAAVIFDVYGTLVVSGSGDVGTVDAADQGAHIAESIEAAGLSVPADQMPSIKDLHDAIRLCNERRVSPACPKPEVDIVDIWRRILLAKNVPLPIDATERIVRLATEYESRANPTWPMPSAKALTAELASAGFRLGIVSNAQVFTPRLVQEIVGGEMSEHGFELDLCLFSNRFGQSKPGPRLFDVLREGLLRRGIQPNQAVYVGNDMLNDVWAASQAGLRTAWFAGDRRSMRRREDDPRCRSLQPDVVITELMQLPTCLAIK
tara:strand:+ start:37908 stop:38798 length:891 start_codon:yes stop_codon:yes gene_type:complete